jgi:hypothetical protein
MSMQRYGFLLTLLFLPCVLTACSYAEHATLFNDTSGEIRVEWRLNEQTVIPENGHAEIHYIVGLARQVSISSGTCEYVYDVPGMPNSYRADRKLDRGIQFQLEKDFSIYLLPANYAGDAPASRETFMQREGFPLKPVWRKCS